MELPWGLAYLFGAASANAAAATTEEAPPPDDGDGDDGSDVSGKTIPSPYWQADEQPDALEAPPPWRSAALELPPPPKAAAAVPEVTAVGAEEAAEQPPADQPPADQPPADAKTWQPPASFDLRWCKKCNSWSYLRKKACVNSDCALQ